MRSRSRPREGRPPQPMAVPWDWPNTLISKGAEFRGHGSHLPGIGRTQNRIGFFTHRPQQRHRPVAAGCGDAAIWALRWSRHSHLAARKRRLSIDDEPLRLLSPSDTRDEGRGNGGQAVRLLIEAPGILKIDGAIEKCPPAARGGARSGSVIGRANVTLKQGVGPPAAIRDLTVGGRGGGGDTRGRCDRRCKGFPAAFRQAGLTRSPWMDLGFNPSLVTALPRAWRRTRRPPGTSLPPPPPQRAGNADSRG